MSPEQNPNEQQYEQPTVKLIGSLCDLTQSKDELRADQIVGIVPQDFSGTIR